MRYLEEAAISATLIRKLQPTIPITLFTDSLGFSVELGAFFTSVLPVPRGPYPNTWGGGLLARIASLACTPYESTIHLDTDTRVLSDRFLELFELCETYDIAMAEARLGESFDRRHCNRRMFNPSVMVYRKEPQVTLLFSKWLETMERNLSRPSVSKLEKICGKRLGSDKALIHRLLMTDQISLVEIVGPDTKFGDVRSTTLDGCFNVRHPRRHLEAPERSVILHLPRKHCADHDLSFKEAERYARSIHVTSHDLQLGGTDVASNQRLESRP